MIYLIIFNLNFRRDHIFYFVQIVVILIIFLSFHYIFTIFFKFLFKISSKNIPYIKIFPIILN